MCNKFNLHVCHTCVLRVQTFEHNELVFIKIYLVNCVLHIGVHCCFEYTHVKN